MSFHKSIPERPHGGTPPSCASTSVAAPPSPSDPACARVPPFPRPQGRARCRQRPRVGPRELEPRSGILALVGLVLAAYLVVLGRLAYWQVWRHSGMARLAAAYHDDTITLPAVRGNILDRNGALLVTNTPVFSIFASPDLLSAAERTEVSTRLAPLLQLSAADIQAKLATTRQFVYLARRGASSVAA